MLMLVREQLFVVMVVVVLLFIIIIIMSADTAIFNDTEIGL